MTDDIALRILPLTLDAVADLREGYLHLITDFDRNWSVGLISAHRGFAKDYALASQLRDSGVPVLLLDDGHLLDLSVGAATRHADTAGNRYLIQVNDVEFSEQFGD